MAIEKWHFQHRDGHTTQKVKKIVVSKTHFIKNYWSDFNKKNFDVKIEGIRILESYSNSIYTYLVGFWQVSSCDHVISAQETFHFLEALLFISSSDLLRGFGLCLFSVTSSKHWILLVTTPTWTYINISSGLTNLNWKWKDIDQNVQKSEVLEKVPFHFDINLFSERLGQFFFR